jgi:protein TonB
MILLFILNTTVMKPSVNIFKSNRPKMLSKREDKKRICIAWNSRLFFQLGVIISLLLVILVMESTIGFTMGSYTAKKDFYLDEPSFHDIVIMNETPKLYTEPAKPLERKKIKQVTTLTNIKQVNTLDPTVLETPVATTDNPSIDTPLANTTSEIPLDNTPKSIKGVEFVPVFPGCETLASNKEKIDCMSEKIKSFIGKRFNTDNFTDRNSGKPQRIDVQFKIDASGNVIDIMARSTDNSLAEEAKRVVNKLPKMQPGRQGGRNVDVLYYVPITVIIE